MALRTLVRPLAPTALGVLALVVAAWTRAEGVPLLQARPVKGPVESLFFPDNTKFSPRYSEKQSRKLTAGAKLEDVERGLGEPLEISERSSGRSRLATRGTRRGSTG